MTYQFVGRVKTIKGSITHHPLRHTNPIVTLEGPRGGTDVDGLAERKQLVLPLGTVLEHPITERLPGDALPAATPAREGGRDGRLAGWSAWQGRMVGTGDE